jgi:hypothetical protein
MSHFLAKKKNRGAKAVFEKAINCGSSEEAL